ncbi:P-loop containing nucleoside triphosphate hydrolase protein [Sordaria brevicollis]|uniref:P-loop containing nucleoside triphosphate hydrolase protein n=1 Tax=Sordaria brevicollis TaxID=83679 RepID=A0AAE0P327_SORBR|nr:P-loop containing nucleoside triphosphate hydrolase protein [Sordaria brevicollis]
MASSHLPRSFQKILPANSPPTVGPPSTLSLCQHPGLPGPLRWTPLLPTTPVVWLQNLLDDFSTSYEPGATIWEHQYDLPSDLSLVQYVMNEGKVLLQLLCDHCKTTDSGANKRPLVLICHGTGGLVAKRALSFCGGNTAYQYRGLIDVLSGVIFLGTPHVTEDQGSAKNTLRLLAKCYKDEKVNLRRADDVDVADFTQLCKGFENTRLSIPILFACETSGEAHSTRFIPLQKLLNKELKHVIVTRELGIFRPTDPKHTILDHVSNHLTICRFEPGCELYWKCAELLDKVKRDAPAQIANNTEKYEAPPWLTSASLRSGTDSSLYRSTRGSNPRLSFAGMNRDPLERLVEFPPEPRNPILPCFSLSRPRNPSFVGRQDVLGDIDDFLLPTNDVEQLRSLTLYGKGGIGKTQLAIEYAYSRSERFDAIFWLNGEETSTMATGFFQTAIQLGLEDDIEQWPVDQTHAASKNVVMHWLDLPLKDVSAPDTPSNLANWLIIFDNVKSVDLLSDHWPAFQRGSVLITSRKPIDMRKLPTSHRKSSEICVTILSKPGSMSLLQSLSRIWAGSSSTEAEALGMLVEQLGRLPLALQQTAGLLQILRLTSYRELFNLFDQKGVSGVFLEAWSNRMPLHLATLWQLNGISKSSMALLEVMSVLGPKIAEEILVDLNEVVKLEGYPSSVEDYDASKAQLVGLSLVIPRVETGELEQHSSVQQEVTDMMPDELITVYEAAGNLLIEKWPFQGNWQKRSMDRSNECDTLLPNILNLSKRLETSRQRGIHSPDLTRRLSRLFDDVRLYLSQSEILEDEQELCLRPYGMPEHTAG